MENLMNLMNVDIVFCVDTTGNIPDLVYYLKDNIEKICNDVRARLEEEVTYIGDFRVKFVSFKDIYYDDNSLMESKFFLIPNDMKELKEYLLPFEPDGGGDKEESSLEAISLALKSEWNNSSPRCRQVIVLFTDNPSHEFLEKDYARIDVSGFPKDLDELKAIMLGENKEYNPAFNHKKLRFIAITPYVYPFNELIEEIPNSYSVPVLENNGLKDLELEDLSKIIVDGLR